MVIIVVMELMDRQIQCAQNVRARKKKKKMKKMFVASLVFQKRLNTHVFLIIFNFSFGCLFFLFLTTEFISFQNVAKNLSFFGFKTFESNSLILVVFSLKTLFRSFLIINKQVPTLFLLLSILIII